MKRILTLLPLATAVGTALAQTPPRQPSAFYVPERFAESPTATPANAERLAEWWKTLHDPMLNRLVEAALDGNQDLVAAAARVTEAQARRRAAAADFWPQLDAFGSAGRSKPSELSRQGSLSAGRATNDFQLGLQASWELDVFGRIRQGVRAAQAQAEATVEARRDVLVLLLAEVASNYVELRGLQAEQAVIQRNITSQEETVRLTRARRDAGVDNELIVAQAEGQLATTRASLPAVTQGIREAIHRIGTLTGQPPGTYLKVLGSGGALPTTPAKIPPGLPSELLVRRPDVRQAERNVVASTAQLGQARAARLPRFALTADTGLQSQEANDLVDNKASLWTVGASISIPLFTGGRLKANVQAAEAQLTQARASYEQSMLRALQEVESGLVAYDQAQKRLAALREAEAQAQKTLTLSTDLYKNGAGDFLNVLEAQRSLLQTQQQGVVAQRQVALNLVGLYKALGGGWSPDMPLPTVKDGDAPAVVPAK